MQSLEQPKIHHGRDFLTLSLLHCLKLPSWRRSQSLLDPDRVWHVVEASPARLSPQRFALFPAALQPCLACLSQNCRVARGWRGAGGGWRLLSPDTPSLLSCSLTRGPTGLSLDLLGPIGAAEVLGSQSRENGRGVLPVGDDPTAGV